MEFWKKFQFTKRSKKFGENLNLKFVFSLGLIRFLSFQKCRGHSSVFKSTVTIEILTKLSDLTLI